MLFTIEIQKSRKTVKKLNFSDQTWGISVGLP